MKTLEIVAEYRYYTQKIGQPYKWFLLLVMFPLKILSRQPKDKEIIPYMYTIF